MRILHLADRLSERGGAWIHSLGILHRQAGKHDIHLAVGGADRGVEAPCPVSRLRALGARERTDAPALEQLRADLRPDVIHVHNVVNPAVLEWAAWHGAVMTVQDHRFFCPGRGKWTLDGEPCTETMARDTCAACFRDDAYFRDIHALTAARLAAVRRMRVIVLSEYMRHELVAAGVPADRIAVIPPFVHGIDAGRDKPGDAGPLDRPAGSFVLFVGRLVAAKGIADVAEAWRRSGVPLPLVVAGTGPRRGEIEAAGAEVLGWVSRRRLGALLGRAAALMMPSRWQEPFGIAGLEAMSCGTPVVTWDSGGIREWHPGQGLVRWGDVDGLAAALRDAIGRRVQAPPGFAPGPLMQRLEAVYRLPMSAIASK